MTGIQTLLLATCVALASAARLTVSIPSSTILPNPGSLPPSTHAVLLGPPGTRYDVPLRRDNTLQFPDLPPASYLLTIHSRDLSFPPLRVDVTGPAADGVQQGSISAWQTFRGNEWSNKGPSYGSGTGNLLVQVSPTGTKDFYQTRGGFDVIGFLKSPMILMALVSVGMIFGLPYIMENSMLLVLVYPTYDVFK